jgi:hypothetical protein
MAKKLTDRQKIAAAKNEWGKTFTLGEGENARQFELKDLPYFDYIEFVQLVKPVIEIVAGTLDLTGKHGEMDLEFNPANLDFDQIIKIAGKDLPKMAQIICKQSAPGIKSEEVANLARRPQRLLEIVLMQILHHNMIQEFTAFFQRLTTMATVVMPDLVKAAVPSAPPTELTTEETLS